MAGKSVIFTKCHDHLVEVVRQQADRGMSHRSALNAKGSSPTFLNILGEAFGKRGGLAECLLAGQRP